MNQVFPDRLSAKVAARNAVHQRVRERAPVYLAAAAPFVGKKILKANGSLTNAFAEAMPPRVPGEYFDCGGGYSLRLIFKESRSVEHGAEYADASLLVGEICDGVLTKVPDFNPEQYKTNFDSAGVRETRARLEKAKEAVRAIESELRYFGEYDR